MLFVSLFYLVMISAYLEILISIYLFVIPIDLPEGMKLGQRAAHSLDVYLRLIGIFSVVFLASLIKLFKHWFTMQQQNQKLINEKLKSELEFLKSQVHPHFLFNTLNSLYALTLKKSEKSPDVVLKLSEILDYMLYQSQSDFILLQNEVKLIENYIDLEKLRYGPRIRFELNISGDLEDRKIAPLILFPFVENSIKHGISKNKAEGYIELNLHADSTQLYFELKNSMPEDKSEKPDSNGGLGLKNVKERLSLVYNENYSLEINKTDNYFQVKLKINFFLGKIKDEQKN